MIHQNDRQQRRDDLTAAIVAQVRDAVLNVLAETSADFPDETKTVIENDLIPDTELVISALSFDELQNERAMERHIDSTLSSARYLISRALDQRRRVQ